MIFVSFDQLVIMRIGSAATCIIFVFLLGVYGRNPEDFIEGLKFRKLQQTNDSFDDVQPSGILDVSDAEDFVNVLSARGINIEINPDDPIIIDTEDNSFSLFKPIRVILGTDERQQVTDTFQLPYKSVGQIGDYCTGTVIGPRHVITAAHCVADPFSRREYSGITFTPARNSGNQPFGTFEAQRVIFPDEFFDRKQDFYQFDWAVIILKQRFGSDVVPLRLANPCDQPRNFVLNIIGYPADKASGTQWNTACAAVWINCQWITFKHSCDTSSGMSGSSLMTARSGSQGTEYLIRGVHSAGSDRGEPFNQGLIITNQIQQRINQIIRDNP